MDIFLDMLIGRVECGGLRKRGVPCGPLVLYAGTGIAPPDLDPIGRHGPANTTANNLVGLLNPFSATGGPARHLMKAGRGSGLGADVDSEERGVLGHKLLQICRQGRAGVALSELQP